VLVELPPATGYSVQIWPPPGSSTVIEYTFIPLVTVLIVTAVDVASYTQVPSAPATVKIPLASTLADDSEVFNVPPLTENPLSTTLELLA
jgi:hypothetical protein